MSRLRQFESDAYGMVKQNDSKPDSGYDTDTDDDDDDDDDDDIEKAHRIARSDPNEAKDADSLPLLGHHTKSKSSHFYKQNSVPLVNGKIPGYEAQPKVAQALYQPQNQAHLLRSTPVTTADIDPNCKGTLDYAPMDSEWGCCCCFKDGLPRFCYKRKIGAAYLCCERTTRTGEPRVVCMLGAGWSFSLATYGLIYGTSGLVFLAAYSSLPLMVAGLYLCVWTFGVMSLACTGCSDPGIFLRYERPKATNWRYFPKTKSYRPPGVTFCSENGFLVEELDHFCPWTGTTIAKKNMCCFQTFLAMIMVTLIATLVMVGAASAHNVVRQCIVTVAFA
eukprot:INCI14344.2.p1 GENE.INCI14344.2~~INCI14344.2.p1  ORF type:complete len:343 (-),score=49.52 INCI14344.2:532-1533(-)